MTTNSVTSSHQDQLRSTGLLDLSDPSIQRLVEDRQWNTLAVPERIGAVYDYVRNEIEFGYNVDDDVPASKVLTDGYGQCNTKATLLMALLRAVDVPCRFHAATIHKRLQRGVATGLSYRLAPDRILHSWVEVLLDNRWTRLEGVILDERYLAGLREHLDQRSGPLLGYGAGTNDLADPPVEWNGCDTEIQMTGVDSDLGIHDDPDTFYAANGTNLSGVRGALYRRVVRHRMNRTVAAIRATRTTTKRGYAKLVQGAETGRR
jgi:hypothetical protein